MEGRLAELQHSEETIKALCKVQFQAANREAILLGYLCAVLCIFVGGIFAFDSTIAVLSVFVGCWVIMGIRQTPNRTAKKIIASLNGKYLHIKYEFCDKMFIADFGRNSDSIPYLDVVQLFEDKFYCYLFLKSSSVYMFNKSSAESIEDLKIYLFQIIGKKWCASKYICVMFVIDIVYEKILSVKRYMDIAIGNLINKK